MSRDPLLVAPEISVVCPVSRYAGDLVAVHRDFRDVLAQQVRTAEFLYVVDGRSPRSGRILSEIEEKRFSVRVFRMARGFGESAALQYAFGRARGRFILTIPDRRQIDPAVILEVLRRLAQGDEVVVTRREPRCDALWNRVQNRAFHWLVRRLVRQDFRDLTCGVRGFTREAAARLDLYGDQHRFIPVIAVQSGFEVVEIPARQLPDDGSLRLRGLGAYLRRLLDILNIYFLVRFTRKPLRFFGFIGLSAMFLGLAISAYLAVQRLLGHSALAGRPLLLFGVLLIVLGVQLTSIGLLGEIIIFLSSRRATPEVREVDPRSAPPETGAETNSLLHRDAG